MPRKADFFDLTSSSLPTGNSQSGASLFKMSREGNFTAIKHQSTTTTAVGSSSSLQDSSISELWLATEVQRSESDVSMMSPVRLHASNIPFRFRDHNLEMLFSNFGEVLDSRIIYNRRGSKGFGFITMARGRDASEALKTLNNSTVDGRIIQVSLATPKRRILQLQASLEEAEMRLTKAKVEVQRIREELTNNVRGGLQLDL